MGIPSVHALESGIARPLLVAAALAALAGGCAIHDALFGFPAPAITMSGTQPAELTYREGPGGLMLIKGNVTARDGGRADVEFILDTGAPVTVLLDGPRTAALRLDTSGAKKLGPADNPAVPVGVIAPGFGIDFGPVALSGLTAVVIAESGMPCQDRFARVGFQGVIGADLFRTMVIEVDAGSRRIRFYRPSAFAPGDMQAIPLTFIGGHAHIDTQIVVAPEKVEQVRLHVDTGSTTPASFKPGARPGLTAPPGAKKGRSCFVEGELETATAPPLTVMLAGLQARVEEPLLAAKDRVHDASVTGSIGASLLARYRYAIDYPGKRLWIGERGK